MVECQICHIRDNELFLHETGMVVCDRCKPQADKAVEMLEATGLAMRQHHHLHAVAA